jgi:hypothetical protein
MKNVNHAELKKIDKMNALLVMKDIIFQKIQIHKPVLNVQ